MSRLDLPQSKLRARRRRQRLFAGLKGAAIVVVVLGIVLGILWLPHLRVTKVEVTGLEGSAAQAVENSVLKYISGTYAFVAPKNNILMYPKRSLKAHLVEQFPRLAEITIHANNFRTIGVVVRERVPHSLWCGASPGERSPCLFMDEQGVAYEAAAQFSGAVYTEYFGSTTGQLPKQYLTTEQFQSLDALVQAFKNEQGESITRVDVDKDGDVRATFENGFTLLFVANEDGGVVYERFLLAKSADPFTTHALADFEYLDLRFGDRLYYKLKTE